MNNSRILNLLTSFVQLTGNTGNNNNTPVEQKNVQKILSTTIKSMTIF